jgi:hypothetical protein
MFIRLNHDLPLFTMPQSADFLEEHDSQQPALADFQGPCFARHGDLRDPKILEATHGQSPCGSFCDAVSRDITYHDP